MKGIYLKVLFAFVSLLAVSCSTRWRSMVCSVKT